MENRDESGSESESGITRRVQQKRQCSLYQAGLLPSPATKTNATHIEVGYIFIFPYLLLKSGNDIIKRVKPQFKTLVIKSFIIVAVWLHIPLLILLL